MRHEIIKIILLCNISGGIWRSGTRWFNSPDSKTGWRSRISSSQITGYWVDWALFAEDVLEYIFIFQNIFPVEPNERVKLEFIHFLLDLWKELKRVTLVFLFLSPLIVIVTFIENLTIPRTVGRMHHLILGTNHTPPESKVVAGRG